MPPRGAALFSIRTERDGIVRRVPMVMQAQGNVMPSLSFEMLRVATGSSTILIRMDEAGIKGVALPGFEMPTDRNGQLWVHFAPHDQARYVSALDLLEGRVAADRMSRRLVLIGTSAAGLLDLKTTPNDPVMPGVEIHAQVLESILSELDAVGAELCRRRGVGRGVRARRRDHRAGADPVARSFCCCSAQPS